MATGFDPAAFAAGAAAGSGLNNTVLGMINGGYGQIAGGDQADQSPGIGQRLWSGLQSHQEGYEQFSADAAKAKALRAVIKSYAADETDPDKQKAIIDQTHTAGLGELEGIVQGHVAALTQRKTKADIARQLAEGQRYQAFAAAQKQAQADDETTGTFLQNYFAAPKNQDPDADEPTDMAPMDRLNYAAKKTPGMSGRLLPKAIESIVKVQQIPDGQENGGLKPKEMTTPGGTRVIYNQKTGAFTTPDKGAEELIATKPKDEDIPDGYQAMQVGKGWQIKPDPSRWATRVEPDPENPLAQIHTQVLLPKPGAKPAAGGKGTGAETAPTATSIAIPKVGEVRKGYRFKGGNPADQTNWVPAQ